MGIYKKWFCPERREYIEFENIKLNGYEYPDYAGALVHCIADRWLGCSVVLLNDSHQEDRYYDMSEKAEAEKWTNIWPDVWTEWMEERKNVKLWDYYGEGSWNQAKVPSWANEVGRAKPEEPQ